MSNFSPIKVIEKSVALLILFALLFLTFLLFNNVYLEGLMSIDKEIDLKLKKRDKIESILVKEKSLKEEINNYKKQIQKNKIFLSNNKASTASSELQNKLKRLISNQSKAKILTIKPYPVINHEGYSESSIELRMKGLGHVEVQNILYSIESGKPMLKIKELDIKRKRSRYKALINSKRNDKELEVTLVVSGYYRSKSQ